MTKPKMHRLTSVFTGRRGGRWANRDLSKCGSRGDVRYQPPKANA